MTLTEFLLARIAEDEGNAEKMMDWHPPASTMRLQSRSYHLADSEAKRRIVEIHRPVMRGQFLDCPVCYDPEHTYGRDPQPGPCDTLRLLALPYADHPDHNESWKP